jgi:hypothetical protein
MRKLVIALTAAMAMAATPLTAYAAPCKDAKGASSSVRPQNQPPRNRAGMPRANSPNARVDVA